MTADALFSSLQTMVQRYAMPIWFGNRDGSAVRNGTATLLRMEGRPLAVTCGHVLDAYEKQQSETGNCILQIGDVEITPDMILARERRPDLATISLDGKEKLLGPTDRLRFYEAPSWPPSAVKEGDMLYYVGFPGQLRKQPEVLRLSFASVFVLGDVRSWSHDKAYTRIEFARCEVSGPLAPELAEGAFVPGGMSGGPVFVVRDASVIHAELVGAITEYNPGLDLLMMHPLALLNKDGTIQST